MLSTLSLLNSDVFTGLGEPPVDYLDLPTIHRANVHSLGFYSLELSQSSENQQIKHIDFTPTTRTWQIVGADDLSVPAWVERQVWQGPYESWKFVPVVNLSQLEDNRLQGNQRVAFYGENGKAYLKLSYDPQLYTYRQHRLWYDANPLQAQTLNATALGMLATGIPANFGPLITWRSITSLLPAMMAKAAMSDSPASKELSQAWGVMLGNAQQELSAWTSRWNVFCFSSRDGQRGRRRKNVLGSNTGLIGWPGYRS